MTDLIIIDITDEEDTLIDGEQNIKEINGCGTLLVKNPSQRSRLWNQELDLKETVNTSLDKEIEVGMINPGQEFKKEYQVEELKEPRLKLEEIFDTNRQVPESVNNTFLVDFSNKCKLTLNLTNTLDLPITDIILSRIMPNFLKNIEILSPNFGEAELAEDEGKKVLLWKVNSLEGKQTARLEVLCDGIINNSEKQHLGALKVTYLINNHQISLIDPEIRGLTDSMSGVTTDEGTKPGTWECNVEFINDSEFQVKLEEVEVSHNIKTGLEELVSESPESKLEPDESWDFDFEVESDNVPQLESSFKFTTLFQVITRLIGEINKESTIYPVLSATIEKAILPPEVDAYANTNMTIENTTTNTGTSNIHSLVITDKIPKDFIPPEIKQITININSSQESLEIHSREEFVELFKLEPEDRDPDEEHKISLKLKALSEEFPPNAELVMKYPLLAKNPKPETQYPTPIEIKANTLVSGADFIKKPDEEPEVQIKYVKRKLKTLKSIRPGINEGEFDISVRIQNKGSVELENLVVKDQIPEGFSLTEFNPKELGYEVIKEGDKSLLTVKIDQIDGKQKVSIKYSCAGDGEYPRTEPQVIVKGRSSDSESKSKPGDASLEPLETSVSGMGLKKQGELHDFFSNVFKQIDRGISCLQLGKILEDVRDDLPPGPVLHQFMRYSRELKSEGEKMIVGSFRDEVIAKVEEFKQKYS
ncbi:MAG: hypothetical protein GF317_14955 [Candidatus Lokiarchaeota archaeon]|nr:hypothetical protein [Candidatus Lokiarchaeota archaeon]MBD3200891.1 hypothetical protein [Candidatus Lokiarchaeota archaeon]